MTLFAPTLVEQGCLSLPPAHLVVLFAVLHGSTIEAIVFLCETSKQRRKLWCKRIGEMAWLSHSSECLAPMQYYVIVEQVDNRVCLAQLAVATILSSPSTCLLVSVVADWQGLVEEERLHQVCAGTELPQHRTARGGAAQKPRARLHRRGELVNSLVHFHPPPLHKWSRKKGHLSVSRPLSSRLVC